MRYFYTSVLLACMVFLCVSTLSGQGEWTELSLFDWSFSNIPYWATSELQVVDEEGVHKIDGMYGPGKLFDGRFSTYWAEGVEGEGRGETLLFVGEEGLRNLRIINGNRGDKNINRIKKADISLFIGFSFPAYVSEITRGYLSYRFIDDTAVIFEDSYDPQDVSLPVAWDKVSLMLPKLMDQFVKRFGVSVADVDVRFIVKFDIKEIYGDGDVTGLSEITLIYDQDVVKKNRERYQRMSDDDYRSLGCFMRQKLDNLSRYLAAEGYLKILTMFAPEDILTYADIYPDEVEEADFEAAELFLLETAFGSKIHELRGISVEFLSVSRVEGLITVKTRFTEKDGSVNDLELYIDGETGQFLAGPMADAKG